MFAWHVLTLRLCFSLLNSLKMRKPIVIILFLAGFGFPFWVHGQEDFAGPERIKPQKREYIEGKLSPEAPTAVFTFAVSKSGNVFAGTEGGVLRSNDNGITWEYLPITSKDFQVKSLATKPPAFLFAGGGKEGPIPPQIPGVAPLGSDTKDDKTVFESFGGVYVSSDNGKTWKQYKNILNDIRVVSLAVNKQGVLFAGTDKGRIFRSADNAKTWKELVVWKDAEWVSGIVINQHGHIFAGTHDGVYRSVNNGVTWQEWNNNLSDKTIKSLSISLNGHLLAATEEGDLFLSFGDENMWKKIVIKADVHVYTAVFDSMFNILAGTNQGVFISTNFAENWWNPIFFGEMPEMMIYALAVKGTGAMTGFVGTDEKIFVFQYAKTEMPQKH